MRLALYIVYMQIIGKYSFNSLNSNTATSFIKLKLVTASQIIKTDVNLINEMGNTKINLLPLVVHLSSWLCAGYPMCHSVHLPFLKALFACYHLLFIA